MQVLHRPPFRQAARPPKPWRLRARKALPLKLVVYGPRTEGLARESCTTLVQTGFLVKPNLESSFFSMLGQIVLVLAVIVCDYLLDYELVQTVLCQPKEQREEALAS